MAENNRNVSKRDKQSVMNSRFFDSAISRFHNPAASTGHAEDHALLQITPITHTGMQSQYQQALHYLQCGHKSEAFQVLAHLLDSIVDNIPTTQRQLLLAVNIVLNIWKLLSTVREAPKATLEKLRKVVPKLAEECYTNEEAMDEKLGNRVNLMVIIWIKQEFENQHYKQALALSDQFAHRICFMSKSDDLKLKFRYVRLKIFNKLDQPSQELDEVNACEALLKNMKKVNVRRRDRYHEQPLEQKQDKLLIQHKLGKRKNELISCLRSTVSGEGKNPIEATGSAIRNNCKSTLKVINLQGATCNALSRTKVRKSISLHRSKRSHSNLNLNKEQAQPSALLQSNPKLANQRRLKGHTLHQQSEHQRLLIKQKQAPSLQYKKLVSKALKAQYKQNDFKELLTNIEHEENTNPYQELLLKRPHTDIKMRHRNKKNEIANPKSNINEACENEENSDDVSQKGKQAPETISNSHKNDNMIHECVMAIQQETFERFFSRLQAGKSEYLNEDEPEDSDNSSYNSSDFIPNEDNRDEGTSLKLSQQQQTHHKSTEKCYTFNNFVLPDQQTVFQMTIKGEQASKYSKETDKTMKCWLRDDQKTIYFTFKSHVPKAMSAFWDKNNESLRLQPEELSQSPQDEDWSLMERNALEKKEEFEKCFSQHNIVSYIKEHLDIVNSGLGAKAKFWEFGSQEDKEAYLAQRMQQRSEQSELLLSKQTVRIYLESKTTFGAIHSIDPLKALHPKDKISLRDENILTLYEQDSSEKLRRLSECEGKWNIRRHLISQNMMRKTRRQGWALQDTSCGGGLMKQATCSTNLQSLITKARTQSSFGMSHPVGPLMVSRYSKDQRQFQPGASGQEGLETGGQPSWIKQNSAIISEFLMQNEPSRMYSEEDTNTFYLAVKSFLMVDECSSIIDIFFEDRKFTFISSLDSSQDKRKLFEVTVNCFEIKGLYRSSNNQQQDLPLFLKFRIEDKRVKTKIHKLIMTYSDIHRLLQGMGLPASSQLMGEEPESEGSMMEGCTLFQALKEITTKIRIYKKITYSHLGIASDETNQQQIYCANRSRYTNNTFLLNPTEYLSPHLKSVRVVYQRPIMISCDRTYAVLTVLKTRGSHVFDLQIYVPKYQRMYSFSFCHEIFQYFKQKELDYIFAQESSEEGPAVPISRESIRVILNQADSHKFHFIWSKFTRMFRFYRKFNAERSYLIVRISDYEAFTKDCIICEYFSVERGLTESQGERGEPLRQNILKIEISLEMNKSGLNFLPSQNKKKDKRLRRERSVKTIFAPNSKTGESPSGDTSKHYHESLGSIYESESNKYNVYVTIVDTETCEKVVYSYFLCELMHLVSADLGGSFSKRGESMNVEKMRSIVFKQLILNHSALWKILAYVKNCYQLKLQRQGENLVPFIFQDKELTVSLKKQMDLQILKGKNSKKISLNSEIFQKDTKIAEKQNHQTGDKLIEQLEAQENGTDRVLEEEEHNVRVAKREEEFSLSQSEKIAFLHKKIMFLPSKNHPISCILYDLRQKVLKIYVNNYKQAKIKELQISISEHSIPYINCSVKSVTKILKSGRERLFKYHQNLIMLM